MTEGKLIIAAGAFGRPRDQGSSLQITHPASWQEGFASIRRSHIAGEARNLCIIWINHIKLKSPRNFVPITEKMIDVLEKACPAAFPEAQKFDLLVQDLTDQSSDNSLETVKAVTLVWMNKDQDTREYLKLLDC